MNRLFVYINKIGPAAAAAILFMTEPAGVPAACVTAFPVTFRGLRPFPLLRFGLFRPAVPIIKIHFPVYILSYKSELRQCRAKICRAFGACRSGNGCPPGGRDGRISGMKRRPRAKAGTLLRGCALSLFLSVSNGKINYNE